MNKTAALFLLLWLGSSFAKAQPAAPLALQRTIELPGVTGRFDHFAIDLSGRRLFAAATGNHLVEVIDLSTDKITQSINGLDKPHGLAWAADTNSLYIADGSLGELRVYQSEPLKLAGTIKLSDDADDMVYDKASHLLYVGHGGGRSPAQIAVVDTATFTLATNLSVASHPEALDLDAPGRRAFANIADSSEVAVVDTNTNTIATHWRLTGASDNVPLAYDNEHGTLYVACRMPGRVIALDGNSGTEISRLPTGNQADDLFYDSTLHRVYVISGTGEVDIYQVDSERKLHSIGTTYTVAGAKTGLFVPSQKLLYIGIPGTNNGSAKINVYSTSPSQGGK